ncbi:MAG: AAA family ATPase [Alphaproteobacteria bacterium]|nr:AAA family ATPase [Alphaproteobacteria bacterium]
MDNRVLFIGGASGSGKTTAAAVLAQELGLHCVHLDEFHYPLHHANRAGAIGRDLSVDLTRAICHRVVEQLLANGAACVVEGGWLTVRQAADLMSDSRFSPLFCAFPEADPGERWRQMREGPGAHWLKTYNDARAIAWLERQVAESRDYRTECCANDVAFVDCSDLTTATASILSKMYSLLR